MKNKLLAIAIASALSSIWSSNLLAAGNTMDVTQQSSTGDVSTTQKNTTTNSGITVLQKNSDATTSVTITQDAANNSDTTVNQYQGIGTTTGSAVTINQSGGATAANATATNTIKVQQGEDGDNTSNVENSLTITTQAGSGNSIAGYADKVTGGNASGTNDEFASQSGAGNTATLNQNGSNNIMGFQQKGASNTASLTQDATSTGSKMNVSQENGDDNTVTASQLSTESSDMNILIKQGSSTTTAIPPTTLDGNTVTAVQDASYSTMMVSIDGSDNSADLKQDFAATLGSDMVLAQTGNSNDAYMYQYGDGNSMSLTQTNNTNTATLNQYDAGDGMTVSQDGNATATLTQGNAPTP